MSCDNFSREAVVAEGLEVESLNEIAQGKL